MRLHKFASLARLHVASLRTGTCALAAAVLALASTAVAAAPMNKCLIDGTVTFQQAPCPSTEARVQPTLEELNAAEKKKRAAAAAARAQAASAAAAQGQEPVVRPTATVPPATPTAPAAPSSFHCDGRTHCSQMRSCAEAKYFLARCPGVKMDGDGNGIPCERQWCNP